MTKLAPGPDTLQCKSGKTPGAKTWAQDLFMRSVYPLVLEKPYYILFLNWETTHKLVSSGLHQASNMFSFGIFAFY